MRAGLAAILYNYSAGWGQRAAVKALSVLPNWPPARSIISMCLHMQYGVNVFSSEEKNL